jgi:hypothetical protein
MEGLAIATRKDSLRAAGEETKKQQRTRRSAGWVIVHDKDTLSQPETMRVLVSPLGNVVL